MILISFLKARPPGMSHISRNAFFYFSHALLIPLPLSSFCSRQLAQRGGGKEEEEKDGKHFAAEREREKEELVEKAVLPLRWKNQPARPAAAAALPSPLFSRACHVQEEAAAKHVSDVRARELYMLTKIARRGQRGGKELILIVWL